MKKNQWNQLPKVCQNHSQVSEITSLQEKVKQPKQSYLWSCKYRTKRIRYRCQKQVNGLYFNLPTWKLLIHKTLILRKCLVLLLLCIIYKNLIPLFLNQNKKWYKVFVPMNRKYSKIWSLNMEYLKSCIEIFCFEYQICRRHIFLGNLHSKYFLLNLKIEHRAEVILNI